MNNTIIFQPRQLYCKADLKPKNNILSSSHGTMYQSYRQTIANKYGYKFGWVVRMKSID